MWKLTEKSCVSKLERYSQAGAGNQRYTGLCQPGDPAEETFVNKSSVNMIEA